MTYTQMNRYGTGIWAGGLRYFNGKYWLYFGTPGEGYFMTTATNPAGPWEPLTRVLASGGWDDCCPTANNAQVALGWSAAGAAAYTDNSAANGTTYYYVVTATNVGGESPASNEASATPSLPVSAGEIAAPGVAMSGGNVAVTVASSVPGHLYQLQSSVDLQAGAWQNIGSPQSGTGGNLSFTVTPDPAGAAREFYRVVIQRQ